MSTAVGRNRDEQKLSEADISRVIEMAWEDRTPFEAIGSAYGLSEAQVIKLMRQKLKRHSFASWRHRVSGRRSKHQHRRGWLIGRAFASGQYKQR